MRVEIKQQYLWWFVFTPSIFIYTHLIMTEWLVMFLLTLLFWLLIQKWRTKYFRYIQFIVVILAFTKPVFYPLIYFNFVFFIFYFLKTKVFSFWVFMPLIVLQLHLNFNEKRTNFRHFSSIENFNLIRYNLYYFKSKSESKSNADRWLNSIFDASYDKMSVKEKMNL